MSDLVLIYKRSCGYYRDEAQGYAELDGAGLFTRERAEAEVRGEKDVWIVEPSQVREQLERELGWARQSLNRIEKTLAIAALSSR
jgi:hypothetical protein